MDKENSDMITEIGRKKYEPFIKDLIHGTLDIQNPAIEKEILSAGRFVSVSRGEVLIRQGEVSSEVLILLSGSVRGFLNVSGGREITDCFAFCQGEAVIGCSMPGEPSLITLQTLTDCEMFGVPVGTLANAAKKRPELYQVLLRLFMRAFKRHWEHKILLNHSSAAQRFAWLEERYPGLIDKVPNVYIASFLGMSPVTLSRIKTKTRKEADSLSRDNEAAAPPDYNHS